MSYRITRFAGIFAFVIIAAVMYTELVTEKLPATQHSVEWLPIEMPLWFLVGIYFVNVMFLVAIIEFGQRSDKIIDLLGWFFLLFNFFIVIQFIAEVDMSGASFDVVAFVHVLLLVISFIILSLRGFARI